MPTTTKQVTSMALREWLEKNVPDDLPVRVRDHTGEPFEIGNLIATNTDELQEISFYIQGVVIKDRALSFDEEKSLRAEALSLAVKATTNIDFSPDDVVNRAEKFYAFLKASA